MKRRGKSFLVLACVNLSLVFVEVILSGAICGLYAARFNKKTVTEVLNEMLTGYDRRVRPNYEGGPVIITVGFTLLSIDTINVIDMFTGVSHGASLTGTCFVWCNWGHKEADDYLNQLSVDDSKKTVTEVLNEMLTGYDRRVRPNYEGGPVIITVGFTLLSIDTINVIDMVLALFGVTGEAKTHYLNQLSVDDSKKTVTEVLNEMLTGYDRRVRPNYEGGPVIITVGFTLLSIDTINVIDMDFSIDMFLRQEWTDERLDHGTKDTMFLSNHVIDRVWLPDSYIVNAKDAKFHTVTTGNQMIMLGPKGKVKYNTRVSVKAHCPMDLQEFPMDTQYCPIIFESYGYIDKHITFQWEEGLKPVPQSLKALPQYIINDVQLSYTYNIYIVGNWSGLNATFEFRRTYSYFIYHAYAPSAIIVIISWIGFVLPRDKPPARITLGVTSVLTVVTILNMLSNHVAKVNYVKRIDQYLIGCFLFVFCSLLEYAIVLLLGNRIKKASQEQATLEENLIKKKDSAVTDHGRNVVFPRKMTQGYRISSQSIVWNALKAFIYREDFLFALDEYSLILFPAGFLIFNVVYWGGALKIF